MSATITLTDRPRPVTVTCDDTVRAIAEAVVAHSRGEGDRTFRVRRPSPSPHLRRSVVFHASNVEAINANGVDLLDVPVAAEAVAA